MARPLAARRVGGRSYAASLIATPVTMGGAVVAAPGAAGITIEGWLYLPGGATLNGIWGLQDAAAGLYGVQCYGIGASDFELRYQSGASAASGVTVSNTVWAGFRDTWIHLAIVLDAAGSVARLHRNGAQVSVTGAIAWSLVQASGYVVQLGQLAGFTGGTTGMQFADVNFYTRSLSAAEIADRYYDGRADAAMVASRVAAYKLGEGATTSAADSSGNARTLTLGSANWSTSVPINGRALAQGARALAAARGLAA